MGHPFPTREISMTDTQKIRELNDAFRTSLKGGQVMMTRGIAGRSDIDEIFRSIRTFDSFTQDNDPHSEHDFGAFEAAQDSVFWKIDYYSPDLSAGSQDPSDPARTTRVLTVMLAQEY
jgi:hypothetical protein